VVARTDRLVPYLTALRNLRCTLQTVIAAALKTHEQRELRGLLNGVDLASPSSGQPAQGPHADNEQICFATTVLLGSLPDRFRRDDGDDGCKLWRR
jgi:ABC-type nitrate/sulfonate/bicarbonate transport system ATPase subunit